MTCPICGEETQVVPQMDRHRCPDCDRLSPMQCYEKLVDRTDGQILRAKELCSEAYRSGDMKAFAEMQNVVKELESMKAQIRKPE